MLNEIFNEDQLLAMCSIIKSVLVKRITILPLFVSLFAVVFLFQGEKGESGSPGKDGVPHQGAIKFSDTADTCTLGTAGTVRYSTSQNALQLCDGSAWLSVVTAGKGHVAYNPGSHCLDILNSGEFLMEQHIKTNIRFQ